MTELEIPDVYLIKALGAAIECNYETDDEAIDAIAKPVVAAELRRLFDEIVTAWDAGDLSSTLDGFRMLTDRALEIDGDHA